MPCTCNQCVGGILSPRMLLRLERTAASSAEMVQDSMPAFQGEPRGYHPSKSRVPCVWLPRWGRQRSWAWPSPCAPCSPHPSCRPAHGNAARAAWHLGVCPRPFVCAHAAPSGQPLPAGDLPVHDPEVYLLDYVPPELRVEVGAAAAGRQAGSQTGMRLEQQTN